MNRRKGYKQARVIQVVPPGPGDYAYSMRAGYVVAQEIHNRKNHCFIDGAINAAPDALHNVGAACWLGWIKGNGYSLPILEDRKTVTGDA